jgi:hypothetical protein
MHGAMWMVSLAVIVIIVVAQNPYQCVFMYVLTTYDTSFFLTQNTNHILLWSKVATCMTPLAHDLNLDRGPLQEMHLCHHQSSQQHTE